MGKKKMNKTKDEIFASVDANVLAEGRTKTDAHNKWVDSIRSHWDSIIPDWAKPYIKYKESRIGKPDDYFDERTVGLVSYSYLTINVEGAEEISCFLYGHGIPTLQNGYAWKQYENPDSLNQFGVPNFSIRTIYHPEFVGQYDYSTYDYRGFENFEEALTFARELYLKGNKSAFKKREEGVEKAPTREGWLSRHFKRARLTR